MDHNIARCASGRRVLRPSRATSTRCEDDDDDADADADEEDDDEENVAEP